MSHSIWHFRSKRGFHCLIWSRWSVFYSNWREACMALASYVPTLKLAIHFESWQKYNILCLLHICVHALSLHDCMTYALANAWRQPYLPYVSIPSNVRATADTTTSSSRLPIAQAGHPPGKNVGFCSYMIHCMWVWLHMQDSGPAAMVWPVRPWPYRFWRGEKGVAWILTYACVVEWPLRAVRRSLGRLRDLQVFKHSK